MSALEHSNLQKHQKMILPTTLHRSSVRGQKLYQAGILVGSYLLRDSPALLEVLSDLQKQKMPAERGNAVLSLQYTVCGQPVVVMFLMY